jgi:hypothetical protein
LFQGYIKFAVLPLYKQQEVVLVIGLTDLLLNFVNGGDCFPVYLDNNVTLTNTSFGGRTVGFDSDHGYASINLETKLLFDLGIYPCCSRGT